MLSENLRTTSLVREHPRLPCVKGAVSRVPRKRETEGLSNLHSQGVPGKRKVLIPSVMALRETAMTAPLGQQGEPLGNGLPLAIIHILIRCAEHHPWSARGAPGSQWPPLQVVIPDFKFITSHPSPEPGRPRPEPVPLPPAEPPPGCSLPRRFQSAGSRGTDPG